MEGLSLADELIALHAAAASRMNRPGLEAVAVVVTAATGGGPPARGAPLAACKRRGCDAGSLRRAPPPIVLPLQTYRLPATQVLLRALFVFGEH